MTRRLNWVLLVWLIAGDAAARDGEPRAGDGSESAAALERPESRAAAERADADASTERALQRSRSATGQSAAAAASDGGSWLRTFGSLLAVIALIVLLSWGYQLVVLGRGVRLPLTGRRAPLIEVVSRYNLSRKQALCLVRVGPRLVLLAVGGEQVRTLDVISDPQVASMLLGQAAASRAKATEDFSTTLAREDRQYETMNSEDARATEADDSIGRARDALLGSLQRLRASAEGT